MPALPISSHMSEKLFARRNHAANLCRFFKVIKLVLLDPPFSRLHQQVWIIIFIGEESVKRKAYSFPFLHDFLIADSNSLGS